MPLKPFTPDQLRQLDTFLSTSRPVARSLEPAQLRGPGSGVTIGGNVTPARESTTLGKIGHVLGTTERASSRLILGNLLKLVNPTVAEELTKTGRPLYASDYIRHLLPHMDPRLRGTLGLGVGIFIDPASYVSFGAGGAGKVAAKIAAKEAVAQGLVQGSKSFDDFVRVSTRAAEALSSEQQVRQGFRSLIQIQAPFLDARHVGLNFEKTLRTLKVPDNVASKVAEEARGAGVFRAISGAQEAIRFSKFGHKMVKYFGATSFADPLAVAIYQRTTRMASGLTGQAAEVVGRDIAGQAESIAKELLPAFRHVNPTVPEKEVVRRFSKMLNELFTEARGRLPLPSHIKAVAKRELPELYTSPYLGGAPHIGDPPILAKIRELVRVSNEFQRRTLRMEADANIPASHILGNPNMLEAIVTDEANQVWKNRHVDAFKLRGQRRSLNELVKKDIKNNRGLFRSLDVNAVMSLIESGVEGVKPETLSQLLGGIHYAPGVKTQVERAVKKLSLPTRGAGGRFQPGKINPQEVQKIIDQVANLEPTARTEAKEKALALANRLYSKGKITSKQVNSLVKPWTVREINENTFKYGLPTMNIRAGEIKELIVEDLPVLLFARRGAAVRAVTDRDFHRAMVEQLGSLDPTVIGPGWRPLPGLGDFADEIPHADQYMFPPDVVNFVESFTNMRKNPLPFLQGALNLNAAGLRKWKAWTLAIFPSYHTRNDLSAKLINDLAGMSAADPRNVRIYAQADRFLRNLGGVKAIDIERLTSGAIAAKSRGRLAKGLPKFRAEIDGKTKTLSMIDLWKEGFKHNLWNTGAMTGDIEVGINRTLSRHKRELVDGFVGYMPKAKTADMMHLFGDDSWFLDLGWRVGGRFDNQNRMAHLMWRLNQGDTFEQAAESVIKFHHDYSDLPNALRAARKHAVPFITWLRKNLPLQMEMLLRRPDKFALIPKISRAVEDAVGLYDTPADENDMAQWMRRAHPQRIRRGEDGRYEYFLLDSWHPAMDLNKLNPLEWGHVIKSMSSPIPKFFIEQVMNQDTLTGNRLDRMEENFFKSIFGQGERERVFGAYLPRRAALPLKRNVRLIQQLDQLLANPDDLEITSRLANLWFGRVYPSDPRQGRLEFMRQFRELQVGYNAALRYQVNKYGDAKALDEARRIQGLSQEASREFVTRRRR